MKFSERIGAVKPPEGLLVDSISESLRNSIWNVIHRDFSGPDDARPVAVRFAREFFKLPTDDVPGASWHAIQWLKTRIYRLPWYGMYEVAEYLASKYTPAYAKTFNAIFEEERSGYRFVNGLIVPITSPTEKAGIEEAVASAYGAGLDGAGIHLSAAITALSQKPKPDYRRCVQEAIHAVESVAVCIDRGSANTLDPALKALAPKAGIHPALQAAFGKMYGYTSDADGIRHAIIESPTVDFADAKYMLVSCSAFVHYLIQKASAAGLLDSAAASKRRPK